MEFFLWTLAALMNVMLAVFTFCILVSGAAAYRAMGFAKWMKKRDGAVWLPNLLVIMGITFYLTMALYCLSALGWVHMPATRWVLGIVTGFYLLRGSVAFFDRYIEPPLPTFALIATYVALALGVVQALGLLVSSVF